MRANYLDHDPIGTEPVDKACVVRAVAVDAGGSRSDVVTQTYFIGLGEKYAGAAVISLVSDPDALFGEEGIYVTGPAYDAWYESKRAAEAAGEPFDEPQPAMNFMQRGAASERAGNLELYDEGACTVNQPVGLRIQGNTGRVGALKRFSIYSRAVYSGSGTFSAPLFPDRATHAVVLRGGRPVLVYSGEAERKALQERLLPLMATLPRGQQLGDVIVTEEPLPRTASGKIKRWELQQKVGT